MPTIGSVQAARAGRAGQAGQAGAQAGEAARAEELAPPALDLDEPGTIEFTAQRALAGRAVNRFALSLRSPASRAEFLADETAYVRRFGLTADEARLVGERDWTGLLRAGGHLQAVLKLAATVGEDLWSIGAHNAGCGREVLIAATPRRVSGVPAPGAPAGSPGAPAGGA
jgi:protocatechuate 4,5-dioxygenase, alpha chain